MSTQGPGEALAEMYRSEQRNVFGVDWGVRHYCDMEPQEQAIWDRMAVAFDKPPLPPVERVPEHYLDTMPLEMHWENNAADRHTTLTLKVVVPQVDRKNVKAGHSQHLLHALNEAFIQRKHRLRLSLTSDAEIQSEFSRMDRDGTVRPLQEDEATW